MDLDALAIFHLVATHGGFGRAARATGRPKATLSRRVSDLENSLAIRLFERGSGSLRLTEDGRALLASTQGPLDELSATEDALRGKRAELRGQLRISVPLLFGFYAMGTVAARFLTRHPKVRMEIVADDRYVDLVQEGFDVAIRGNPKPSDELVGRCFLRDQLLVVAPPMLKRPEIAVDSDPTVVPAVLRTSGNDASPWLVNDNGSQFVLRPEPVLRFSNLSIMRDAVLAGAGAALLPSFLVREHVEAGRLSLWGHATEHDVEIWVLHASTRHTSSKVKAFVDFLVEAFPEQSLERALPRVCNFYRHKSC